MNVSKVLAVAKRELTSTVLTKAFVIGAFVVPGVVAMLIPLIVKLTEHAKAPALHGTIAIVDRSGQVAEDIEAKLSKEGILQLIAKSNREVQRAMAEKMKEMGASLPDEVQNKVMNPDMIEKMVSQSFGPTPDFSFEQLPADADIESVQDRLKPMNENKPDALVAVVEIDPDAVEKSADDSGYGGYKLYVRAKTDDRHIDLIRKAIKAAILDQRYARAGVNEDDLVALTTVPAGQTQEIKDSGQVSNANTGMNMMLPFGFMLLLIMSVMVGGQYLLTTTVEEKQSRVVEVLLSAVSPMELMTGKIIGQMGVGMVLLSVYASVGLVTLKAFAMLGMIHPSAIVYLIVYFVLAYFIIASLMAAVGASVNEMREAQSLMGPVMMIIMLPYFFWMPISRDPNSTFAVVMSMLPPMSPFAMIVRITSNSPPPLWQVLLSIGITAAFAIGCALLAAKVFRVGLLMFGKPPNFKTLIRWVRMA